MNWFHKAGMKGNEYLFLLFLSHVNWPDPHLPELVGNSQLAMVELVFLPQSSKNLGEKSQEHKF